MLQSEKEIMCPLLWVMCEGKYQARPRIILDYNCMSHEDDHAVIGSTASNLV